MYKFFFKSFAALSLVTSSIIFATPHVPVGADDIPIFVPIDEAPTATLDSFSFDEKHYFDLTENADDLVERLDPLTNDVGETVSISNLSDSVARSVADDDSDFEFTQTSDIQFYSASASKLDDWTCYDTSGAQVKTVSAQLSIGKLPTSTNLQEL